MRDWVHKYLTEIFIRIALNFRLICGNWPVCNGESPNPWIWYISTYLDCCCFFLFFFQFYSAGYYIFHYIGPVHLGLDFSSIWSFFNTIVNYIICKYYFMCFLKCWCVGIQMIFIYWHCHKAVLCSPLINCYSLVTFTFEIYFRMVQS